MRVQETVCVSKRASSQGFASIPLDFGTRRSVGVGARERAARRLLGVAQDTEHTKKRDQSTARDNGSYSRARRLMSKWHCSSSSTFYEEFQSPPDLITANGSRYHSRPATRFKTVRAASSSTTPCCPSLPSLPPSPYSPLFAPKIMSYTERARLENSRLRRTASRTLDKEIKRTFETSSNWKNGAWCRLITDLLQNR